MCGSFKYTHLYVNYISKKFYNITPYSQVLFLIFGGLPDPETNTLAYHTHAYITVYNTVPHA